LSFTLETKCVGENKHAETVQTRAELHCGSGNAPFGYPKAEGLLLSVAGGVRQRAQKEKWTCCCFVPVSSRGWKQWEVDVAARVNWLPFPQQEGVLPA